MKETKYQEKSEKKYDGSYESLENYKLMPKYKGELEEIVNNKTLNGGKCEK